MVRRAATEVFVVKTFFTDRYHDILYTFCLVAVGAVGTVENRSLVFHGFHSRGFHGRGAGKTTALLFPVLSSISRTVR
jgi:hypothetical protein